MHNMTDVPRSLPAVNTNITVDAATFKAEVKNLNKSSSAVLADKVET